MTLYICDESNFIQHNANEGIIPDSCVCIITTLFLRLCETDIATILAGWQLEWLEEPKPREVQLREKKRCPLKCLKVVELRWFRGSTTDVELATYLFTNSPSLEKIRIDTRNPYAVGNPREELAQENVTAKECARQLAGELYPGAELQVL